MKNRAMKKWVALAMALPALAQAHEGHGQGASVHWHATDVWGFVVAGVAGAAAAWFLWHK